MCHVFTQQRIKSKQNYFFLRFLQGDDDRRGRGFEGQLFM